MGYLEEFQSIIENQDFPSFLSLWEEYCLSDTVDGPELKKILKQLKESALAPSFGAIAESLIPLWEQIKDLPIGDEIFTLMIDLETTNSPRLADLSIEFLKKKFPNDKNFNEKLRLVGLRNKDRFQGAISNFVLLSHMEKGKFVFHLGGWGVGEILEISLVREHLVLEFEGIAGRKDISFENAFKNLIPINSDHFLARRFGNPDLLEKEGRENPLALIKMLLRDVGPKNAAEIKDELCDLVIPEEDWGKWWQLARTKIKKDTHIKVPESLREPFEIREVELSHDERFKQALKKASSTEDIIQTVYSFTRDFPEILKNSTIKTALKERLLETLKKLETTLKSEKMSSQDQVANQAHLLQIHLFLEDFYSESHAQQLSGLIQELTSIEAVINSIEIIAFKKRVLVLVREARKDWQKLFLHFLFITPQNVLKDYILKELLFDPTARASLTEKLRELISRVTVFPEAFLWYFQKIVAEEDVPLNDKEHKFQFLEAFLILLHFIEQKTEYRELVKKMHQILTAKRYSMIRAIIDGASISYLKEFLLLVSKCQSLTKQDLKIMQSLAEVVQPTISDRKKEEEDSDEVIWTTQQGYQKIQERIHHIGTVETVDNAREIEAARALGDLRENSEYKFALERRSRLQGELKTLTVQLNSARILTREDISNDSIGVGTIIDLVNSKGQVSTYTLLGPWDADPDQKILSFQSKLAQSMMGKKIGDEINIQGEIFKVQSIRSYL